MNKSHRETFTLELPRSMRKRLEERALTEGRSVGFIIRRHLAEKFLPKKTKSLARGKDSTSPSRKK